MGASVKPTVRVGLTREQIVERALALMDERGIAWVTMRRLADALGVSAPTIYWHVRDRRALLDAAADAALEGIVDGPEPSGDWEADVRQFMRRVRAHLTAHPCVTELMRDRYPASAEAMTRRALAIFEAAGMSPADAANSARLMMWRVLGFATLENNIRRGTAYHEPVARRPDVYRVAAPPDAGLAGSTGEAERQLQHLDLNALFDADINLFVRGIAATPVTPRRRAP